jgi:hypothetical protein
VYLMRFKLFIRSEQRAVKFKGVQKQPDKGTRDTREGACSCRVIPMARNNIKMYGNVELFYLPTVHTPERSQLPLTAV